MEFSLDDKIKALRREIALREYVYPKQILAQKITKVTADWNMGVIKAILEDYLKQFREAHPELASDAPPKRRKKNDGKGQAPTS